MVAFDADDTLWHNEDLFEDIQNRLSELLCKYRDRHNLDEELVKNEARNLDLFGYGIKSFTLSMIETAIEMTDQKISAKDISQILNWGKEMLAHPVQLIDGVRETILELSRKHTLGLITKGELFLQETRIARSGLADYFTFIKILSNKRPEDYQKVLEEESIDPQNFIMVGNSLYSDILPVVELGATAVHIPYHITWELEEVSPEDIDTTSFIELESISALPTTLKNLTPQ